MEALTFVFTPFLSFLMHLLLGVTYYSILKTFRFCFIWYLAVQASARRRVTAPNDVPFLASESNLSDVSVSASRKAAIKHRRQLFLAACSITQCVMSFLYSSRLFLGVLHPKFCTRGLEIVGLMCFNSSIICQFFSLFIRVRHMQGSSKCLDALCGCLLLCSAAVVLPAALHTQTMVVETDSGKGCVVDEWEPGVITTLVVYIVTSTVLIYRHARPLWMRPLQSDRARWERTRPRLMRDLALCLLCCVSALLVFSLELAGFKNCEPLFRLLQIYICLWCTQEAFLGGRIGTGFGVGVISPRRPVTRTRLDSARGGSHQSQGAILARADIVDSYFPTELASSMEPHVPTSLQSDTTNDITELDSDADD